MLVPSSAFSDLAESLALDIVAEFKARLDTFSLDDRAAAFRAARRYANLLLLEKAGHEVDEHKQILEATLANWKAAGQIELYDGFYEASKKVVSVLGVLAGKTARAFIGI